MCQKSGGFPSSISNVGKNMTHCLTCIGVAFTLITKKPNSAILAKELEHRNHVNKVCHHTFQSALSDELFNDYCSYKEAKEIWDSFVLKYPTKDVVRQWFIISNYYHLTMIEDKDIKVQINKYHNLLENTTLPDEFVFKLLVEKLPESQTSYNNS